MTVWWIKNAQLYVFLSQVKVYNMEENKHGPDDVLVMGTDGLWDVTTDREVADAVSAYLSCCDPSDPMRYAVCQIILYIKILLYMFCHVNMVRDDMNKSTVPIQHQLFFLVLSMSSRWWQIVLLQNSVQSKSSRLTVFPIFSSTITHCNMVLST